MQFKNRVLKVVSEIPKGEVLSYKQVAERAGSPRAYRAVGNIMKGNRNASIPCHRVICSSGRIGGYNRGESEKRRMLKQEGFLTDP
jgi:O-6-methylguanine DNA methyltransferase